MDADPAILSDPWSGRPLGANPMRFMQRFTMFLRQQMAWYYLEIRRSIRLNREDESEVYWTASLCGSYG